MSHEPLVSASSATAKGRSAHVEGCSCTRCVGFEPGNEVATRHGSYATLALVPRASEIADEIRDEMADGYERRFELLISSSAAVGARYERALMALTGGEARDLARLDQDARGWARLWFACLDRLGITPDASERLRTRELVGDAAQAALDRHRREHYGRVSR